ncbi:MAG: aminoacyl-tRNA hydrolase [Treponema sp.]|nr:aminoacyl-tRNA hydrolase [Treponema sp.]MBQ5385255.1 aminoacyl-tRNA hydrolase [Treponema sp.]
MIQLIAFLGNYGREYEQTRHNVAWLFESSLPFSSKISWSQKYKAEFCAVDYDVFAKWLCDAGLIKARDDGSLPVPSDAPKKIYFMKPLTYMNLSGEAIGEAARFFKIPPSDILIVHDEIELPIGTISLKWSGGLGGHNGLRSAKSVLGTADFWRLRFGVGKPSDGNVADYVLGSFTPDERIILSQVFVHGASLFSKILTKKDCQGLIKEWGKKKVLED